MHVDTLPPPEPVEAEWSASIVAVASAGGPQIALQPIVNLDDGTPAIYEALARFPADARGRRFAPDVWFAKSRRIGQAAALEASAIRNALLSRPAMRRVGAYLSVNISPDLVATEQVRAVWAEQSDLHGVVIELTEQSPIDDYAAMRDELAPLRARGALIAVDDAGAGYAGLQHLLSLRPDIVKLDRDLVTDIDRDEAKVALIELMVDFNNRIGALLVAEGVERVEELDVLMNLGIRYAQGYVLAAPATTLQPLAQEALAYLRARRRPPVSAAFALADLVEPVRVTTDLETARHAFSIDQSLRVIVVLDERRHPLALVNGDVRSQTAPEPRVGEGTRMRLSTSVDDALRRAMVREPRVRFEPILVIDDTGRFLGIVWMERLIAAATAGQGTKTR